MKRSEINKALIIIQKTTTINCGISTKLINANNTIKIVKTTFNTFGIDKLSFSVTKLESVGAKKIELTHPVAVTIPINVFETPLSFKITATKPPIVHQAM